MKKIIDYIDNFRSKTTKSYFSFYLYSLFFVICLFNPVFQKYDYGAGVPIVMLFSVFLIFFLILEFREKRERAFLEKVFLATFALTFILAYYFSETKNLSFPETIAYLSIIPFYFFFAHKKIFWKKKLLNFYGVCGFLAVCLGFILYFVLDPTRMTGPFFNVLYYANFWPNAFATFLIMIWPIYLIIFEKRWNFVNILIVSFIISGLLLTFSRGALIASIGQLILLAIFFFKKIKVKTVIYFASIVLISLTIFSYSNYVRGINNHTIDVSERISFQNNEIMTSGQERKDFWSGAITLTKEKPLFGYGPFSFRYAFNPHQKIFLGSSDHAHNIFLKLASENGLINLFSFLAFLFLILYLTIKRFNKISDESKNIVLVLGVSVVGVFAHSLIDYNFNFFQNLILLVSLLVLIRSELVLNTEKAKISLFPSLFSIFVFMICLFQLTVVFLSSTGISKNIINYSLYQRYTHIDLADDLLHKKEFKASLASIEKHLSLNSLDSQAYYLRGVIYCSRDFEDYDLNICKENFAKTLKLNPRNDVMYYRDYLRVLEELKDEEVFEFRKICLDLFNMYYGYTKYNVHFTAYTPQVEASIEMARILLPNLEEESARKVREKIVLMTQYAKEHRGGKTF